jgi:hypothetical protein
MLLKLLSLIMLSVHAWGPKAPLTSKRPVPRPANLQIVDRPAVGEIRDGKVTLRIVFPNDGLYYQRNNRTHNIPIMHYFKNEYPDIDFSNFRINRMSINSRAYSDEAFIGFHNKKGRRIKKANIPIVAYPGEPLGEYSQTIVERKKLRSTFSFISIKGVIGINNITLEMEQGRPNFTFDTRNFSVQGNQVNPIRGYIRAGFEETRFTAIMKEVIKMSTIPDPQDLIEEEFVNENIMTEDDTVVAGGEWTEVTEERFDNDDEIIITELDEIEDDNNQFIIESDLYRFPQRSISIGRLKSKGGLVRIERISGSAALVGFHVIYRDGRSFYQNYNIPVNVSRPTIDLKLSRSYSYSTITLYFENVSKDGEIFLDWWEL